MKYALLPLGLLALTAGTLAQQGHRSRELAGMIADGYGRMRTRQVMEAVTVVVAVAGSWYIGLHLYQGMSVGRYGHGPWTGDLATLGLWSAFVTATFIPFAYARAAEFVAQRPFTIVARLLAGAALGVVLSALPLVLSILVMGDGIPPTMPLRFVLPFFAWLAVMGAVITATLAAIRERK